MHPDWRRCSSLTYSRYARSSRLARRAPRRPRCVTVFMKGSTKGIFVISAAMTLGCSSRHGTPRTMPSGKEVRLLFADVVEDSFFLEYCTELALSDRRALASETDEVFNAFRADITESG